MMDRQEEWQEKDFLSRSDKIQEAKSSFCHDRSFRQAARRDDNVPKKEGHPFGMVRMLMAGMLFLLLVTAFHFQVSFGSFNKQNVKKMLNDEKHWQSLVEEVTEVVKNKSHGSFP